MVPVIDEIIGAGITSDTGIADALNARGVPTARGGRWFAQTVANVRRRAAKAVVLALVAALALRPLAACKKGSYFPSGVVVSALEEIRPNPPGAPKPGARFFAFSARLDAARWPERVLG